jgi:hypothetical protein
MEFWVPSNSYPYLEGSIAMQYHMKNGGFCRPVSGFLSCRRALNDYFRRSTARHLPDGSAQVRDGMMYRLPFTLIGFVDFSMPHSGPAGDFVGASRRREYAIA